MNWLNLCSGGEIGRQAVKELGLPVTNWFSSEVDKFAIIDRSGTILGYLRFNDVFQAYHDKVRPLHPSAPPQE